MTLFKNLLANEEGATAIEYGLIAALIAVAAITAMGALGNSLSNTFNLVSTQMNNASDGKLYELRASENVRGRGTKVPRPFRFVRQLYHGEGGSDHGMSSWAGKISALPSCPPLRFR